MRVIMPAQPPSLKKKNAWIIWVPRNLLALSHVILTSNHQPLELRMGKWREIRKYHSLSYRILYKCERMGTILPKELPISPKIPNGTTKSSGYHILNPSRLILKSLSSSVSFTISHSHVTKNLLNSLTLAYRSYQKQNLERQAININPF